MRTRMEFLASGVVLSGAMWATAFGAVNSQEKDRMAITEDGRRVILKADGTWQFAPDTPRAAIALPSTKRTDSLAVTLLDVYKTGDFFIPGMFGPAGTTHKPQAGYEFVVVRSNVDALRRGTGMPPGSARVRLYDSIGTLCNQFEGGRRTANWTEIAFELPVGRQLGYLSVGEVTFDLAGVTVRTKK